MSYVKNTWQSGDIITAAKLNNLENGVEGASASSLPQYSSQTEKDVLSVNSTGELEWRYVSELPDYPPQSPGKVLGLNDTGEPDGIDVPGGNIPTCSTDGYILTGSSNTEEAVGESNNALPDKSDADEGYVLALTGASCIPDGVDFIPVPGCCGANVGDILILDENNGPKWDNLSNVLPSCSTDGYVLSGNAGDYEFEGKEIIPTCNTSGYVLGGDEGNDEVVWTSVLPEVIEESYEQGNCYLAVNASGDMSGTKAIPSCSTDGYILMFSNRDGGPIWVDPSNL